MTARPEAELMTVLVGTRFRGPDAVAALRLFLPDDTLQLVREPDNPFDPHAVACHYQGMHVGYISRWANTRVAEALDAGVALTCAVWEPAVVRNGRIHVEPKLIVSWPEPEPPR